jgi:hypothetical protein
MSFETKASTLSLVKCFWVVAQGNIVSFEIVHTQISKQMAPVWITKSKRVSEQRILEIMLVTRWIIRIHSSPTIIYYNNVKPIQIPFIRSVFHTRPNLTETITESNVIFKETFFTREKRHLNLIQAQFERCLQAHKLQKRHRGNPIV